MLVELNIDTIENMIIMIMNKLCLQVVNKSVLFCYDLEQWQSPELPSSPVSAWNTSSENE